MSESCPNLLGPNQKLPRGILFQSVNTHESTYMKRSRRLIVQKSENLPIFLSARLEYLALRDLTIF